MTAARNQSVMPRGLPSPSMIRLMRAADQRRRRRRKAVHRGGPHCRNRRGRNLCGGCRPTPSAIARVAASFGKGKRPAEIKRRVAMRWLKWRLVYDRDAKYGEIPAGNH